MPKGVCAARFPGAEGGADRARKPRGDDCNAATSGDLGFATCAGDPAPRLRHHVLPKTL
jgi:hypothetical protein